MSMKPQRLDVLCALVALAVVLVSNAAAERRSSSARIYVQDFSPSWSPNGKRVVFARARGQVDPTNGECCLLNSSSLHVVGAGGGSLRRVRGDLDFEPAWSPSGKLIAFLRRGAPALRNRLFVMRSDGSGARAVRGVSPGAGAPTWSPSGKEIAFWQSGNTGRGAIYSVRPDGSGLRKIVADADYGASWSPDGKRVLFARAFDIYVVNANGSNVRRLTRASGHAYYEPTWSPDGRRIVFRSELGLYVMRADGTGIRRITRATSEIKQDISPAWSPTGAWIAFAGFRQQSDEARLYRVAPSGRGLKRLTTR
jgi:Tol biopolymer transport system component